ncbi:MAG: histidine phosphatase family protein [Lachnospiraceae bacterium]
MELVFIRHGKTKGNLKSRYIGITDEGLCKEGIEEINGNLCQGIYPAADIIFTSPMKRCIQTAEIIYPGKSLNVIYGFREINFGRFEGKNYFELSGSSEYQEWIDSKGTKRFPGGEDRKIFSRRCTNSFNKSLIMCRKLQEKGRLKKDATAVFIVHGGTIMSVMESVTEGGYFDYQCSNAHGYSLDLDSGCIAGL